MIKTTTTAFVSMNTSVTATGMEVKASASASLAISADGSAYSNNMALATKTDALSPTSMVDNATTVIGATSTSSSTASTASTTAISFYTIDYSKNKVNNPNSYAAEVTLAAFLADKTTNAGMFAVDSDNYVTDDLWVKYTAESGDKAAKLKITVTHPIIASEGTKGDAGYVANSAGQDFARDIENAFHVALVDVNGKVWNYDVTNFVDTDTNGDDVYDSYVLEIAAFTTLTAQVAQKFTVYAWYEGEDTDCTTAKAISVSDLIVNLEFSIQ